jgi:hypothetical protein
MKISESLDKEIEAIRAVLAALAPLAPDARAGVLDYVLKRLGVSQSLAPATTTTGAGSAAGPASVLDTTKTPATHIKDIKSEKKPRSANEMAALVAYFLSNIVPHEQRKQTVNSKDMETYFKIAEFPLPEQIKATLPNAKNAGYFDLIGDGEYRLNAVGHNLVAHSMPRGVAAGQSARRGRKQKTRFKPKVRGKKSR